MYRYTEKLYQKNAEKSRLLAKLKWEINNTNLNLVKKYSFPILVVIFYTTLSYLSILFAILFYNYNVCIIYEVMNSMRPLKEKISITIDNDLLAKLRTRAESDDRSLSQYINLVLKQHVEGVERKN